MNVPSGLRPFSLTVVILSLVLGPAGVLPAQDAEFISVLKSQNFRQVSPNFVTLMGEDFTDADNAPFTFEAFASAVSMNSMTGGTLDPPAGPDLPMAVEDGGFELIYLEGFEVLGEMNDAFGDGSYTLDLVGANDGPRSVTLNLSGNTYPGVTRFTMFTAAQNIDASADMTFQWDSIPNGTADDFVFLCIEGPFGSFVFETPDPGEPGALDGLSISVVVPAGTLSPGTGYEAYLEVFKPVDANESYALGVPGFALYGKSLFMPVRTAGAVDATPPSVVRSIPFDYQPGIELNTIVTFVFDEPMDTTVDESQAINWTGVLNAALFDYSWSPDGTILFCNYTPGLPASATIEWTLNPPGSVEKLRDVAGNDLPVFGPSRFDTASTSNLGVADVRTIEIVKGRWFFQDGAAPTDLGSWFAEFFVDLSGTSTVSSVDLGIPGGAVELNAGRFEFNHEALEGAADFGEKADLDRIFPNGDYQFTMHTFHDGDRSVTLNLGPDSYPNAPTIQNFAATQSVDSGQPFTLQWAPMEGGTANDFIELFIGGDSVCFFESPCIGEPGALDGTDTSVTIPADALPPGRWLEGELVFVKIIENDTTQYPGARGVTAFVTVTEFELRTIGAPFRPELQIFYDGAQVRVTVIGEKGRLYELRASENMRDWVPVNTQFLFSDCRGEFRSSFDYFEDIFAFPRRFYIVEEIPLGP